LAESVKTIRLLAVVEADSITGPAKNLLQFAHLGCSGLVHPPIEVSIAVFQRGDASHNLFLETARQSSIPVYPIPEAGRFDWAVVPHLRALARELKPDLIQTHAVKSHFLIRASGLHCLAPWVAFHHGYTWPDLRMRLYNQVDRWSLRAARQVLTVSRPFRDELTRKGVPRERIEIVHNAIDPQWGAYGRTPEAAAALRVRLGIGAEKKIILIVGRLSREKDHRTLLEAVDELRTDARNGTAPPTHLVVVGDGPERPGIEEIIRALGLGDAVTLVGQVPTAEPYYGIADVSVLSSLSEGSPNALLESMAACVPVVATSVGGIPEMVSHQQSALLIDPRDRAGMTRAIKEILANESLARNLAAGARQRILAHHTPDSRARRLAEIYGRVLG
jgi:glycosyltransferase involved in cell wall biosynthesis